MHVESQPQKIKASIASKGKATSVLRSLVKNFHGTKPSDVFIHRKATSDCFFFVAIGAILYIDTCQKKIFMRIMIILIKNLIPLFDCLIKSA